jgi:hypothetical protein
MNPKYKRKIYSKNKSLEVDVYDVLKAFQVTCPALSHLSKKALCAGLRGHKDTRQDLIDIIDSAKRALEMHDDELASYDKQMELQFGDE